MKNRLRRCLRGCFSTFACDPWCFIHHFMHDWMFGRFGDELISSSLIKVRMKNKRKSSPSPDFVPVVRSLCFICLSFHVDPMATSIRNNQTIWRTYACYPGEPWYSASMRNRQNIAARSAPRGALPAKQTAKNKSEPISTCEIVRICFVWWPQRESNPRLRRERATS